MEKIIKINKMTLDLFYTKFRALQFKTVAIIGIIALFFLWSGVNRHIKFIFILVVAVAIVYAVFAALVLFQILYKRIFEKDDILFIQEGEQKQEKNKLKEFYYFQDYLPDIKKENKEIQFVTGVDENGKSLTFDLVKLTHCFVAGMQGGGKSNLLNVIIQSMMYFNDNIFYILVDFKFGAEMVQYENFKNTLIIEKLEDFKAKLIQLEVEMEERYGRLKSSGCKKISQYNKKNPSKEMAYIVLVIDEMSDIRMGLSEKEYKPLETKLIRILNMARACGILVIGATQRPSSTQINTDIRDRFGSKFSARIKDKNSQKMAGIIGTENLKDGEFLMEYIEDVIKFKAFFINELTHNEVYENLSNNLKGGVNLDKIN